MKPAAAVFHRQTRLVYAQPPASFQPELRHHKAVCCVTHFTPGQFRQRVARVERCGYRRELHANADGFTSLRQGERQEEFVIAETAVRGLNDVLRSEEHTSE